MFATVIEQLTHDEIHGLGRSELAERLAAGRRLHGAVTEWMARVVREAESLDDGGLDGAGLLRVAARMSSRAAASTARTADALGSLPRAAAALREGRITAEHAATLAEAAQKISAEKADGELVEHAAAAPADVFARRAREWIGRNQTDDEIADAHARARHRRDGRLWKRRDGTRVLHVEFDPVTGAEVESTVAATYDRAWHDDGGRDGRPDVVRTREQRMADVVAGLLTGGRDSTPAARHPRHQLTAVVDISRMSDSPTGEARLIDGTPLPQPVLERLACDSVITGVIFDGPGRPLWLGRDLRSATTAQWKALVARDGGCVGCGAAPDRCEAHHIVAWRAGGPTDITNLVLVCTRCHHDLHDRGMELARTPTGWTIRPRAGPIAA